MKYNIYIVKNQGGKAQQIIGRELSEERAEKRVMAGLTRIDTDNYFVSDIEVGSAKDLKYQKDL